MTANKNKFAIELNKDYFDNLNVLFENDDKLIKNNKDTKNSNVNSLCKKEYDVYNKCLNDYNINSLCSQLKNKYTLCLDNIQ